MTCRGLDQVNPTDTRVTPHSSPLMIILFRDGQTHWVMDIQPFSINIAKFSDSKSQRQVHHMALATRCTWHKFYKCANMHVIFGSLVWEFIYFWIITFFSLEVYKCHFTQSLKGKKKIFSLAFDIHFIKIHFN